MTVDQLRPGTHFTEIVAQHFSADHKNYAKMGSSNFVVRLQIEEAIKQRPDLIMIGFTGHDRIEVTANNNSYNLYSGIRNVEYSESHATPEFYNCNNVSIISKPICIFENTKEFKEPVKNFILNLYNEEVKRHQDFFIATGALDKLLKYNIPFVFTPGGLILPSLWDEWQRYSVDSTIGNPWNFVNNVPNRKASPVYHTTFESQKLIASEWIKKINEFIC